MPCDETCDEMSAKLASAWKVLQAPGTQRFASCAARGYWPVPPGFPRHEAETAALGPEAQTSCGRRRGTRQRRSREEAADLVMASPVAAKPEESIRDWCVNFYATYNPEKLASVDAILSKRRARRGINRRRRRA